MNLEHFYNEEFTNSISKLTLKAKRNISNRALFLDRDGVLIEDVHHIDNPNKVLLCENVKEFLKGAKLKGYNSIVITNQSSVSRSIITYEEYKSITNRFLSLLTEDLYPELILSSFHLPNNENNLENYHWRKPGTGMIDFALDWGNYERSSSIIVGDKLSDLKAGYSGGISRLIYIKSSLHKNEALLIKKWSKKNNIYYQEIKELDTQFL